MDSESFETLIGAEEAKLADLESAAVAAKAAEEGTAAAVVGAKLDGKPGAELRRLEAYTEAAVSAREASERAVARQRSQIVALRSEHEHRTHRAAVDSARTELQAAREAWPAALAAWDAAVAAALPLWNEMHRLQVAEQVALRRLERHGIDGEGVHIPTPAGGQFPISATLNQNLHWTFEAHQQRKEERRQSWEQTHAEGPRLVQSRSEDLSLRP